MYGRALAEEMEALVEDVGLRDKRHVPSSALSGGMKVREVNGLHNTTTQYTTQRNITHLTCHHPYLSP